MENKLKRYIQKRNFKKTTEPKGEWKKASKKLRFVIQHHLARRDHYDLRLEWQGTMKSWAIPKGPSYSTHDKRLAIEVEDHPLSYRNFEGNIPKGEYGGGTVMIWDEGYWKGLNNPQKAFSEGDVKFTLYGKKLKGDWKLIYMKDNQWLFIKASDDFSNDLLDIKNFDKSVKSGRTMQEIKENN